MLLYAVINFVFQWSGSDWQAVVDLARDVWKSTTTASGALSAMITSTTVTPQSHVSSWDLGKIGVNE